MNKKIVLALFGLLILAAFAGVAKAQINVTITLTDASNNAIGSTVPIGTTIYAHGFYQDLSTNTPAAAVLEVDYNSTGPTTITTLYSGTVTSGQTITEPYTLTAPGTYLFKWTCTQGAGAGASSDSSFQPQCIIKVGYVTATTVVLPTPEAGPLAGLIMALAAFGLLAYKKGKR